LQWREGERSQGYRREGGILGGEEERLRNIT